MSPEIPPTAPFAERLLAWFDEHGRRGLPWQQPRSAYRVWLSEVMLQQTQVATVVPYFERFVARFPDFATLAAASQDEVLQHWAGLGYYARGRNLHRAAQLIVERHQGVMPRDFDAVQALPGIGRSTAAAILAQAYGLRHAILDGNVKRVLARHGAIEGWPGAPAVARRLWALAETLLPHDRLADYTQALMDLGATLCMPRQPACPRCPVAADCAARRTGRVADYPGPKPKRLRPRRRSRLLLVARASDGALLLERRPPVGLWGGLWCAPIVDDPEAAVDAVLEHRYGLVPASSEPLAAIEHAFTHFDLELQPIRVTVEPAAAELAEPQGLRWTTMADSRALGVPAPLRRLLDQLSLPLVP